MTSQTESKASSQTPIKTTERETAKNGATKSGPGRSHRKGITLAQLFDLFPDDQTAREWFESKLWPRGAFCPRCGSKDVAEIKHPSMTHRCRDCRRSGEKKSMFSVRVNSIMEDTKLGYRTWALAIYLMTTSLKGVSSMKLHRDLGITQKAAWHLAHRIRRAYEEGDMKPFEGPTEFDETLVGGRVRGAGKKGPRINKAIVVGAKDRTTKRVRARMALDTKLDTIHSFVDETAEWGSMVYTDGATVYRGLLAHRHEWVNHSAYEFVRGQCHTNGIESFWAGLKRGYEGVYHKMSFKHLDRYVDEFVGRHNSRDSDTLEQMEALAEGMRGKRLEYEDLIADNGLPSGARSS